MEAALFLDAADGDARALLRAAATDWERRVTQCPEWDAADLIRHTGGILEWMSSVMASGERVSRRALDPAPEAPGELSSWYLKRLERTLQVLRSAEPETEVWTFSTTGDRRVAWWDRRLAVEAAIHRWDAEDAVAAEGGPPAGPLDGEVAAAGIEEFVIEFLPGLLSRATTEPLDGTLHLHATDGTTEWSIDLSAGGRAVAEHAKADTAIRGTRSDILLWLTNRGVTERLQVFGGQGTLSRWGQLSR